MAIRTRVPWSLDEFVLRQSSVQGVVINHIMSNISEGINTQKIRAGYIKTTEFISSENYVAGSAGWIIDGNGDAEFNDIVVRGDIVSDNWDGADPVDLSSGPDFTATQGFALDASSGNIQAQNFFVAFDNPITGNAYIHLSVGATGDPFEDYPAILFQEDSYSGPGFIFASTSALTISSDGSTGDPGASISLFRTQAGLGTGGAIEFFAGGTGSAGQFLGAFRYLNSNGAKQLLMNENGSEVTQPSYSWDADQNSGMYWIGADQVGIAVNGSLMFRTSTAGCGIAGDLDMNSNNIAEVNTITAVVASLNEARAADGGATDPSYTFTSQENTGMSKYSSGAGAGCQFSGDGSIRAIINVNGLHLPSMVTTATAADCNIETGSTPANRVRRVTSALKYKSRVTTNVDYLADIELVPTKHWRRDDKKWMYGFVADWLGGQDEMLVHRGPEGDIENYDDRAVLAVMAAKINRLERRLEELTAK